MLKSIREFVTAGIKQTITFAPQLLIVVLLIFLITLMGVMIYPINMDSKNENFAPITLDDTPLEEVIQRTTEIAAKSKIVQKCSTDTNNDNTIKQRGYGFSSFDDVYQYGLYPASFDVYEIDSSPDQSYEVKPIEPNNSNGYMLYPTTQYDDTASLDRSTHTWSGNAPSSDFRETYEWGNFPTWFSEATL